MECPFEITVYDGAFTRRGWVGDPLSVVMTERHNGVPTAVVVVPSDHRRIADLTAEGARLVVDYGSRRVSGMVVRTNGKGPALAGTVELTVAGDFRVLGNVLGWPVPGAALGSQTSAYDVRSGPAETVLKGFVSANVATRLGRPLSVAVNLGRGSSIKVEMRFHPLLDRLLPAVEEAGLGISVVQDGAGLVLDVYEPAEYPRVLSEAGGQVRGWSWTREAPTATRVICGDQGEATARSFTTLVDSAREAAWDDVVEVFVDARDTTDSATLAQRRADAIADGAPKSGFSLELAESSGFRYGDGLAVGDRVSLEVGPGVVYEDVLREAVLAWTARDGLTVTPVVGERTDSTTTLARFTASLARAFRHLASGR